MIEISHLLKVINSYQAATGLTDSSVSTYVFNDGKKITRLRHGGDLPRCLFDPLGGQMEGAQ